MQRVLASDHNYVMCLSGLLHVHHVHVCTGKLHVHSPHTTWPLSSKQCSMCRSCVMELIVFVKFTTCACIHRPAVLLCLVCLFDLACFFLSSFSSLIKTCIHRPCTQGNIVAYSCYLQQRTGSLECMVFGSCKLCLLSDHR